MVTHHEVLTGGHGHLERQLRGRVARVQVGFVNLYAVDLDLAVAVAFDHVTGGADNALDQEVRGGIRQNTREGQGVLERAAGLLGGGNPALRVLKDNDVAALGLAKVGARHVNEHAVVDLQGLLHGAGRNVEAAQQEGLHQECDDQRVKDDGATLACLHPEPFAEAAFFLRLGVGQLCLFGALCLAAFPGGHFGEVLGGFHVCGCLLVGGFFALSVLRGGRSRNGGICGGGARLGASYHLVIALRGALSIAFGGRDSAPGGCLLGRGLLICRLFGGETREVFFHFAALAAALRLVSLGEGAGVRSVLVVCHAGVSLSFERYLARVKRYLAIVSRVFALLGFYFLRAARFSESGVSESGVSEYAKTAPLPRNAVGERFATEFCIYKD
ncbi:Uncharacterised protein [Mycobacterium tuberculosis]|nr:Uncharacterised protein [Mycobacterium tuberculosis]